MKSGGEVEGALDGMNDGAKRMSSLNTTGGDSGIPESWLGRTRGAPYTTSAEEMPEDSLGSA